jgi:hypothetical protein
MHGMSFRTLVAAGLVAFGAGCSTGDPNVPGSCEAGEVASCKGASDCPGKAVCKDDGLSFGPCQCAADSGAD